MIKMSFYNGTLNRDELEKFILKMEKPVVYTYGFAYRRPTTYRVSVSVEQALDIVRHQSYLDATEEENCLHLNAFSDNDMW